MARIKEIERSNEPSLQRAMLAFGSEKASPYSLASELGQGLVIAKKGMSRKKFSKDYSQGSIENDIENDSSCVISVLVGTKGAIHKWIRMSGHARCALWIEHSTLGGENEKIDSCTKLELVYRQRDYRVSHVQVLQECKLVLSPTKQLKPKKNITKSIGEDNCEFDWNGLRQQELKQTDSANESKGMDKWKKTSTMRWYIQMKVRAFKKLKNMLCPGGALWEFRRLLSQVINLPEFLDIDFQNINLQERLTHHPYAVFLTGHDVIMTRSTSKGIFMWKIVRFDFDQGIVTLCGGETLKGLMDCIKKHTYESALLEGITNNQQIKDNGEHHQNLLELKHSQCCCLDWAIWRGVYRAGPMETILTSAFVNEEDCMVLKALTTFFSPWKNKDFCRCCEACDLGTAFRECRDTSSQSSTWKLSSMEICAISHLRSVKKEVRRQGLRTLLNILFHELNDLNVGGLQKTTLSSTRTPRRSTRSTSMSSRSCIDASNTPCHFQQFVDSKREVYLEEKVNVSLLSRLVAVMDRPLEKHGFKKDKKIIGSETERALLVAELKWKCFEEMKSDRSSSMGERIDMKMQNSLRWQQIVEWVDNGFLEILLNEGMNCVLEDEKVDFLRVEDLSSACLQVVKMLPREGSFRIVNCLVSKLQSFIYAFTPFKISSPQQVGSTRGLLIQEKIDKLKICFQEMVQFCKLLGLLVKSSTAIASTFADLNGLFLILNLYQIFAKEFPIDVNNLDALHNDILTEDLPGEASGLKNYFSTVLKPCASISEQKLWLDRPKKIKSKARLPLQEVFVPSEISHVSSVINLKVSRAELNKNVQSSLHEVNLGSPKTNLPMTIERDITTGSYRCSPQVLTTLIEVIWKTKIHLLQSLATMFESQSITLNKCKAKMRSKLLVEATSSELLSLLLLDLIGGHSNAFPPYISSKLNKLIFKIIFLLEKDEEGSFLNIQCPQKNQFNFQYIEEGPQWSGPGPPPTRASQIRLLGLMLVELKERMDHILSFLMVTIPGHVLRDGRSFENYTKMTKDNAKKHIYSLWINLSFLFMVLYDYISCWPGKESKSQHVLQCCGGHFHQTLTLFSSLGPIVGWHPAQILTIQSLLKLLILCIENSITTDTKENWSEYENFLWEMLVDTWAHWNCIQSCISWMTLETCQGCLILQINDFQKSLLEPIYLYYLALEEKLGIRKKPKDFFENFQCLELVPRKEMMFFHLVVLLAQRKFYTHNYSHQDGSAYLCFRNNALWFLHEIMNPLHGLLIMNIKNRPHQTCTNCNIETIKPSFLLDISSSIEQYSLILLAQIFNFKLLPSNVSNAHVIENYNGSCTNVYLSKKYLIPFLHVLYSRFKILYSRVIQQMGLNSLCTLQETQPREDENKCPLSNQSNLESIACNDKIIVSAMNEILNLCYLHVQVLHAIAKNLSKDGNQIFKDLCVMDFLVKEISLEYEFSQIEDAKSDSKFEIATNYSSSNLPKQSSRKNPNILKCPEDSKSCSNSIESCCMLPSLSREYELKHSTVFFHDYMPQRSSDKCDENDDNPFASLQLCKLGFDKNHKLSNYLCESRKKISVLTKDATNCNDNNNIVKNDLIQLSCNSIYETINFGSNILKNSICDNEYSKKKVIYSGRFFDLNEEVERELSEEDDEMGVEDKHASIEEIELTNIERQMKSKNINNGSISPSSTIPTSCRIANEIVPSTLNTRPWVPKLNFTTALQKAQSNMASGSDCETIHNELEEQYCSNEDNNVDFKSSNLSVSYEKERLKRSIYHNSSLHILLLEFIISLMLDPQGALEVYYCDRFPMEHRKINAPFYLYYHINHANNESIVPTLAKQLDAFHPSACRILKLTWQALFDPTLYTNRIRIAQGALSQVYTAIRRTIKDGVSNNELVVLKVVALPKGPHEPCSFFDVYSEVQILERFKGDPRVCQILDYGVDCDAFVLVLKHYKCSLRDWRHHHIHLQNTTTLPLNERLPLYLQVYAAVLHAVKALELQNVVHYDLKCDNVLLEPVKSTVSEEDFWNPRWPPSDRTCVIPFHVSITDFGQSKASYVEGGECTARNRGTECVKSPEMLKLLSNNSNVEAEDQVGTLSQEEEIFVGKAADVWGLGCLLYELLTGEYLLYDEDWVRFFVRVTSSKEELISHEKAKKLDNNMAVINFLHFILVRDPSARPTLDDLALHLEQLQETLGIQSPNYTEALPSLHAKSPTLDIFDELASDMEEEENEEPLNQESANYDHALHPTNARPLQNHADGYKRCQTPSINPSKYTFKDQVNFHGAKRPRPRLRVWQWCCACCWKNTKLWR